jgi:hypothetical protein
MADAKWVHELSEFYADIIPSNVGFHPAQRAITGLTEEQFRACLEVLALDQESRRSHQSLGFEEKPLDVLGARQEVLLLGLAG